jgi:SAM-dependent methyltransferase
MTARILHDHRELWKRKPVLRAIYADFYQRIVRACRPGRSLEIGGGSGNLKEFAERVVSTDIVPVPWLDAAADAQALPFAAGSFANIVAVDVLHHIERPRRFLTEAQRVLEPGGRLIVLEPAITPLSWIFYRFFHPEPVNMSADPLADGPIDPIRAPFDANQGIPTLLFGRDRAHLARSLPGLKLLQFERLSLFAYPLSGGFRPWCLVPEFMVAPLLKVENAIAPAIGRLAAFRLLAVVEKLHATAADPQ